MAAPDASRVATLPPVLIRHLVIGGLRSYPALPTRVPLAPLTLVFGPNSAGKSSLLSVLPMLAQTAVRPDVLAMTGDLVEAGSFRMAVHRHDTTIPVTLGFGWTSGAGVPRDAEIAFRWDQARRAAVRWRTEITDGDDHGALTGPRPWGPEQPGLDLFRRVTDEFWGTLERVHFLGPMRQRAERATVVGQVAEDYVGPAGEHMTAILGARRELLRPVNAWCDRLGLGYQVRLLDPVNPDIVEAGDFTVLALEDVRHDPPVLVSPHAVGYGIGQVLPIVVQTLLAAGDLMVIEQPEVHLHPRLQSALADLFADTVLSGRAQLLVETHSEHMLLRLLRRVREGRLDPDDLAVLYVDLDGEGAAYVRRLEVDREGDLIDGWPGSFFDERLEDVVGGRLLGGPA